MIALVASACATTESADSADWPRSTTGAPATVTAGIPASSLSEPTRSSFAPPAVGAVEQVWRAAFETTGARPGILVASTTLVVADIRAVVAFDLRDGTERWRVSAASSGWMTVIADRLLGRDLLVVLAPGEVGSVDIESGEIRWRNRIADGVCASLGAPVVVDRQAYLTRACGGSRNNAQVIALDASSGSVLWRHDIAGAADDAITAPALIAAGLVIVGAMLRTNEGKREQTFVALDRVTGALRWQSTLLVHPENQLAALISPRLVGDVIVVADAEGPDLRRATGLDVATGRLRWRSNVIDAEVLGDVVVGRDAGRSSAHGTPSVLAVSASTGQELWRLDDVVQPRRSVSATAPLILASDQLVLGVDPHTGSTLWRAPLEPFDFSDPTLIVTAQSIDDRTMVLLRTSTGKQNRSLTVAQPVDMVTGTPGRTTTIDMFTLATTVTADGAVMVVGRINRPEQPWTYAGAAIALKRGAA